MRVRALWFSDGRLVLVDQRRLPGEYVLRSTDRVEEVADSIRTMVVRGAPSIGVAAAYGMALAAQQGGWTSETAAELLRSTRPTAHDLFVGVERVRSAWAAGLEPLPAADAYRAEVIEECHEIGRAAAPLIRRGAKLLTHCNAGALATVEWGTALAPVRVAHEEGRDPFVWVDETRPLLQGARLTAWELVQEGIRHALIVDGAAGSRMRAGEVDAVIVGADRIARNGDFANKIGTYSTAVVAHENGIPFYVAAPFSTFDPSTPSGARIPVEERAAEEVRTVGSASVAPPETTVRNPAFDVTPARYVTGFLTPIGVVRASGLSRVVSAAKERSRSAGEKYNRTPNRAVSRAAKGSSTRGRSR